MINFGRVYRLQVGAPGDIIRTYDGFPDPGRDEAPLHIEFTVDQTPNAERSYATISIYGLALDSRKDIYGRFNRIKLEAGYESRFGTIFEGHIENIETNRDGANSFLTFFCQSGAGLWQTSAINRTLGRNTAQREIILAAAESFGLPVEFRGDFSGLPRAMRGKVLSGDSREIMRGLAQRFGFAWYVQGERLYVVRDGYQPVADRLFRYSPTTGLIGTPQVTQKGIDIDVLLNPVIQPYDLYTVESETAALTFNGVFYQAQEFPETNGQGRNQVLSLTHEGSLFGDVWQTSIEGRSI